MFRLALEQLGIKINITDEQLSALIRASYAEMVRNERLRAQSEESSVSEDKSQKSQKTPGMDGVTKLSVRRMEMGEGAVSFRVVDDPKLIAQLEASPKRLGYRNVVLNEDGTFSSPMAYWLQHPTGGAKTRVEMDKFKLGEWEEAVEHPEVVDESGKVTLVKPNKKLVESVAYDPYIHNRLDPVNLQFKEAWRRNDLVYVETEVAEIDLNSGYHADKALLSVGVQPWSNGALMLSKYDKPVRILPWEEVADAWAKRLDGKGVEFDVVPPALLPLLAERGVEILPPHKGMGKDCNEAYEEWKEKGKTKLTKKKPTSSLSLLDVVRTLYSEGKDVASKLFQRSFFDVAQTPKFMQELGLRGDKFTIKYGVIARHLGKDGSHDLSERDWEQLPQALQNPFAISKLIGKDKSYRIYTALQTESGEYIVVGADVKNAGREIEVNAVSTVFGRRNNAHLPMNEEVIYRSNEITPEQSSLLERPNFAQYTTEQELSVGKDTENNRNEQEKGEKVLFSVKPLAGNRNLTKGLRELEDGETCQIERIFTESKSFEFSSVNKVETYDDVAYIFKNLEDEAIENAFAVLVKRGKPTVIHLGMGHYTATMVNKSVLNVAVNRVKPDKIYFVHNHPSGALRASKEDILIWQNLLEQYGDKLADGIIINTRSGWYGVFNDDSSYSAGKQEKSSDDVRPLKVYSFNKQVFAKDYVPQTQIYSSSDVASFVSAHRLGDRQKLGLIITNNKEITGNIFLPYTEITKDNARSIANDISYYTSVMGGTRAFMFGNVPLKNIEYKGIGNLVRELSGLHLLDYVEIDGGRYKSANDEGVRFSVANDNQEVFVSNAEQAVKGIKQEKATPQQWKAMIQSKGGLKAGEDKWLGLSEWLDEKAKAAEANKSNKANVITKQEVLDFIGENKIKIEEVKYGGRYYKYLRNPDEGDYDFTYAAYEEIEYRYGDIGEFDYWPSESFEFEGDVKDRLRAALTANKNAHFVDERYYDFEDESDIDEYIREVEKSMMDDIDSWIYKKEDNDINSTRLEYTTEGLKNKREIALTVPTIESWNEGDDIHFGDAGGGRAVAWARFGETTDSEGNSVLVIDEIQSKRHQDGREKGYKINLKEDSYDAREKFESVQDAMFEKYPEMKYSVSDKDVENILTEEDAREYFSARQHYYDVRTAETKNRTAIPYAPFDKNWHELAMKRMLRLAAEEDYDKVAWTTGAQQAKRYNLGTKINHIHVIPSAEERYVSVSPIGGRIIETPTEPNSDIIISGEYKGKSLAEVFGKSLADKILSVNIGEDERIAGDGLHIGGEGMKGFYDKMLPSFMNKYGKKWGVKVEEVELPELEEAGRKMWSVDVTPEMKESVMEGQVMFRIKGFTPEEQEIIAEAKKNGTWMKAPNGKPTNLTEKQWAQVRTKAFKKWFGDWEKALKNIKIVAANKHNFANFKEAKQWAKDNIVGTYSNSEIGNINISGTAIDKYLSGKAVDKSVSLDAHLSALLVLPQLIEESIVGEIHEDKKGDTNLKDIVRLYGAVNIDGELSRVKITVKRYADSNVQNKAYSYEVTEIEPLEGTLETAHTQGADSVPSSNGSISAANLLNGAESAKEKGGKLLNVSKIVDENGEPMVVYHGTNADFTVFNKEYSGQNTDDNASDEDYAKTAHIGHWFNSNEQNVSFYGRTMNTYISLKNPLEFTSLESLADEMGYYETADDFIEELKADGYDGVIINDEELGGISYCVLQPNQIKSATDNVGTFDEGNEDIRFSVKEYSERFDSELQQQIDGTLPVGHIYQLGMPSMILRSCGIPMLPIELAASRLSDKSMQENHPFDLSEAKGLVEAVQNPFAVFRSATHIGSFVVLTEIQHDSKNYVVAIETNRKQGRIEVNSVRSVYPKNSTQVANWIEEGLLEYADKKRMPEWFSKQRSNSADVRNLFKHAAKIIEDFENPKHSEENVRFRFVEAMDSDEIYEELSILSEWSDGAYNVMSSLEEYYGGEILHASRGARYAIKEGRIPVPGRKYSGKDGEYHHFEFRREDGDTFVESVPFVDAEDAGERGIRFSFIGERGAANLDKSEEATTRLDNLSVAAIPQIIENSIYIASEKNEDTKIDTESFDYYVCGLKIGNEDYTVKSVIATLPNGARYYDHKLTTVEKGKLIDLINKLPNHVSNPISSESSTESGNYYVGKDTRLFSILQTNASKIVDENGEPMVIYHGTMRHNFTAFKNNGSGISLCVFI